jgi:hypothetical protein
MRRVIGFLSLFLLLALAACAEGSHASDNRHPDMRHGNIQDPGWSGRND